MPPSASGVQDSQEWPELAPDSLSYLARDLIGGQLSRPRGKQTRAPGHAMRQVRCGGTFQGQKMPCSSTRRSRSLIRWSWRPQPRGHQGGLGAEAAGPEGAQKGGRCPGLLRSPRKPLRSWAPGTEEKSEKATEPGRARGTLGLREGPVTLWPSCPLFGFVSKAHISTNCPKPCSAGGPGPPTLASAL